MTKIRTLTTIFALSGLLGACGSASSETAFGVDGAWSRPTPAKAVNGVIYMTINSDKNDILLAAEVPSSVARGAELHGSMLSDFATGGHHGGGNAPSGEAIQVEKFSLEAGKPLEFRPGGNHVMLIDLVKPLNLGTTFDLTLRFGSGRTLVIDVVVADNPPD